jgi:gamma-glutamylputrescine oxidase
MLSFWEQQTYLEYDFIVVGAGIMGCSVAYELRFKYPKARIVVLERGLFPTGASTKNAGFACFGSPTEIISDFKLHGTQKALDIISNRYEGLKILIARLGSDQYRTNATWWL